MNVTVTVKFAMSNMDQKSCDYVTVRKTTRKIVINPREHILSIFVLCRFMRVNEVAPPLLKLANYRKKKTYPMIPIDAFEYTISPCKQSNGKPAST